MYIAAVRNLVVQNSTLGKRVQQSRWTSSDSAKLALQENRTLAAFQVDFDVIMSSVVSERYGPPSAITPSQLEPVPDPTVDPGRWPVIVTGDVTFKQGIPVNSKPLNLWWRA